MRDQLDQLDQLLDAAMQTYDRYAATKADPETARILRRDRARAVVLIRCRPRRAAGRHGVLRPSVARDALMPQSSRYGWPGGSDRRWRRVRELQLARAPLCEICGARGHVAAATTVHHRVPIAEGGAKYDYDNLQSVCDDCHKSIHTGNWGCDADGYSLDPNSPWARKIC